MLRGQCVEAAIHLARQLEGCNGEVCRRVAPMPVPNLSAPPTVLVNLYDQTATCCRAERLIDMMINAPHIKCSVVMPGHIGTSIPLNTRKVQFFEMLKDQQFLSGGRILAIHPPPPRVCPSVNSEKCLRRRRSNVFPEQGGIQ